VLHAQRRRGVEIGLDRGERLPGRGGHQVEAHGEACFEEPSDGAADVVGGVIAVEHAERGGVERLATEAHPCDSESS